VQWYVCAGTGALHALLLLSADPGKSLAEVNVAHLHFGPAGLHYRLPHLYEFHSWRPAVQSPKPQKDPNQGVSTRARPNPLDEYVRKGRSPYWLCFVAECLQCGKFFRLRWPAGIDHFEETDIIHVECPSCLFEFSKSGVKLVGAWTYAGMVQAGRVSRVEAESS
jgi:hypothetical protein